MQQSSTTIDPRPSDDSDSSGVDAEIADRFSPHGDVVVIAVADEESLTRKAEMYQDFMKQIPIPKDRGSLIPFKTWVGLSNSIKELYGQPLHYLTNFLLQNWDQTQNQSLDLDLDSIIHPYKAEATIWLIEEVHRNTSSHLHIAHLWKSDPVYHSFIDPIFPKL